MKKSVKMVLLLVILSVPFVQAKAMTKAMTFAIFDFDNNSFMSPANYDYLSRVISEVFIAEFAKVPNVKAVERIHMQDALEELKLGSNDLVDQDTRLRLGKLVQAKNMIFGSFIGLQDHVRLDVRVVKVETTEVLVSEAFQFKLDDLMPTVTKAARKIQQRLGLTLNNDKTFGKKVASKTWKLYDKGIRLMDQRKYEQAIEVFTQVLSIDASFALAEKKIQQSLERLAAE